MIIDAQDAVLGRLASHVAKELLLGKEIVVVNSEKSVVTGKKETTFQKYKEMADRGHRYKGPFFPKTPHMIFKRTVRGMLPWKSPKGREAFKRLKVHIGVPEEFRNGKLESFPELGLDKSNAPRFVRLSAIAKFIGWKPLM